MDRVTFEQLVRTTLDELPPPIAAALDEVVVVVEDHPPTDDPDLYGLYTGVPLDEPWDSAGLPPRVEVYMSTLIGDHPDPAELAREVRITVLHELGHHLGLDERDMERLGID